LYSTYLGGLRQVIGHIFQGPVEVDDIQYVFAHYKDVLARVAGGNAQGVQPLINVVVVQPAVEDDVVDDAPSACLSTIRMALMDELTTAMYR